MTTAPHAPRQEPCPDQALLLHGLLDGELDASNALRVEAHLEGCCACAEAYARLRAERQQRRQPGLRHRAPDALRERLAAAIAAEAAGAPAAPAPLAARTAPPGRPPREGGSVRSGVLRRIGGARGGLALALAACLAVFAVLPRGLEPGEPPLPDELVSGHVRSLLAAHLTDVTNSDQHGVKPWFAGRLDFAPPVVDLADRGFSLVGGRLDYINGRVVAALVYRRRDHVINLFIWPGTAAPGGLRRDRTSREGYSLLRWVQAGLTFWAVSDLNPTELSEFEQDFAARAPA
ncbi:hypothetical protein OPKNFCMD_5555 [Methylobacterium crusticola]|uniref:Putative zinc-finger domain-containing protein n=1 Tax=Methylobacterium crusticola TaxID=1697972 RepID=A0ABQ4R585_9HYPH|nr:zf-HC2 domain-containing protein [Methylobacterium crusticola]GJD52788.1 hypothetical protein OPKNFCMD_5555 [Methylobacterium crusticola]